MKRIAIVLVIVLLLALPAGAALAAPAFDTVVESGETINNDVIVLDGDLEVESGAVVNGDVIVFNGDAFVDGTINGDLVLFNGDLETDEDATLNGDCVLVNGAVHGDAAAGFRCTNIEGQAIAGWLEELPPLMGVPTIVPHEQIPEVPELPERAVPELPERSVPSQVVPPTFPAAEPSGSGFLADFARAVVSSVLLGAVAFATAVIFPAQLHEVTNTVRRKPLASGAVGLLTAVAVPSLAVILLVISAVLIIVCIGLLGFPLVMVMMLAFAAALVMGWIAVGSLLGRRLFDRKGGRQAMAAALGTMILTFVVGVLGSIPFVFGEGLLSLIIASVGLGAVALTQFGRKPYPQIVTGRPEMVEDADKVTAVLDTLPEDDFGSKT